MPDPFNVHTRSRSARDHSLLTPDTFVRASLPGMKNAVAIVHAAPAHGAAFTEYTVEFDAGGSFETGAYQTFLYVLAGAIDVDGHALKPGQYVYIPPSSSVEIRSPQSARAVVIEKSWLALPGQTSPALLVGNDQSVDPVPMLGDESVTVQTLLPADYAFDLAVNIMTFQPGATLPMVEAHVMEHGLLMLEGGGIYRLGESWYPVMAGDFIWMAPFCPQWFGALGKTPAKYLIYKDWNRHPLQTT
jgi:(S)-ureidoglycine aminohydrolase